MAVTPGDGNDVAERVARTYQDAELALLRRIVAKLQRGIELPDWQARQLANLQFLREEMVDDLRRYNRQAAASISQAVADAYTAGAAGAISDLSDVANDLAAVRSSVRRGAVEGIAREATGKLTTSAPVILRHITDAYQSIIADSTGLALTGSLDQKSAVQRAITQFLGRGITGFSDSNGRRWNLSDYAQMATGTATSRALLQAHDDTMQANGFDLCVIQPGPRACDICDPYASQVLSISGSTPVGRLELESMLDGTPTIVYVDGTLAEARARGWGHPNCRCGKKGFFPGVTRKPERKGHDADAYAAQQRQRTIEKQIRNGKVAEALAITPDAATKARGHVAAWQQRQRDHMKANPFLKRQYGREQIGLGDVNSA
jgi:hypothetical protein